MVGSPSGLSSVPFVYLHAYITGINKVLMVFVLQFLQLYRPPSLPPIFEMARPELKLAGMRIDPDIFSGSKKGYSIDMAIVDADQVITGFSPSGYVQNTALCIDPNDLCS